MIIAIDFDGTVHTGVYPSIGFPRTHAKDVIRSLRDKGHYVIIWTCRTGDDLLKAVNWLLEKGFEFDKINDNHPSNVATYGGNTRKVYADIYIDDKQVGGLPPWKEIENFINKTQNGY